MNGKAYFSMLARYHRWAYGRLYERVNEVRDADYFADRQLFFGSIHKSLNHLLLVDRLWLTRLRGEPTGKVNLAEELETGRADLERALFAQCDAFIAYTNNLAEEKIDAEIDYVSSTGEPFTMSLAPLIAHIVNHGAHHRGQISAALTKAGIEAPVMDIPYFLIAQR